MKEFDYFRPTTVEEACRLSGSPDEKVKILAGGTDLLIRMKNKVMLPEKLVSLRDVPGLSSIAFSAEKGLSIGSMVSLSAIEDSSEIKQNYPAIIEAAGTIGSVQIRNRATLGGNVCNASPAADMLPILIAFSATAVITDGKSDRTVLLENFYTGPGSTAMKRGELLRGITLPLPSPSGFYKYIKASRTALDCAGVGVGAMVEFNKEKTICQQLRLVLGAVSPTVVRAKDSENLAAGQALDDQLIGKISQKATEEINPITDIRCSADYRNNMVSVNTRRVLLNARTWAEKGGL
jgi:aerobic carbon-monoxide dehydrogenase medium subunit